MQFQIANISGGVSLRDTDQNKPDQCRVVGKIYDHSDADNILRACNSYDKMVYALKAIAEGHGCPSAVAEDALSQIEKSFQT